MKPSPLRSAGLLLALAIGLSAGGCGRKLSGAYASDPVDLATTGIYSMSPEIQKRYQDLLKRGQETAPLEVIFDGNEVRFEMSGKLLLEGEYSIDETTLTVRPSEMAGDKTLALTLQEDGNLSYNGTTLRKQ